MAQGQQALRKRKILIVEDDLAIVDAMSMMLEISDYQVCAVMDGDVVQKAKAEKPDLLLVDVWLSGTDGRDVCRRIKQDDEMKDVPVVLISASRDLARRASEAGADDFLEKPFEMDALLVKLEHHLAKH